MQYHHDCMQNTYQVMCLWLRVLELVSNTIFEFVLPLWERVETCFSQEWVISRGTAQNREPRSSECPNQVAVWAQKRCNKNRFFSNMAFDRLLSSTWSRVRWAFWVLRLNYAWRVLQVHHFSVVTGPNYCPNRKLLPKPNLGNTLDCPVSQKNVPLCQKNSLQTNEISHSSRWAKMASGHSDDDFLGSDKPPTNTAWLGESVKSQTHKFNLFGNFQFSSNKLGLNPKKTQAASAEGWLELTDHRQSPVSRQSLRPGRNWAIFETIKSVVPPFKMVSRPGNLIIWSAANGVALETPFPTPSATIRPQFRVFRVEISAKLSPGRPLCTFVWRIAVALPSFAKLSRPKRNILPQNRLFRPNLVVITTVIRPIISKHEGHYYLLLNRLQKCNPLRVKITTPFLSPIALAPLDSTIIEPQNYKPRWLFQVDEIIQSNCLEKAQKIELGKHYLNNQILCKITSRFGTLWRNSRTHTKTVWNTWGSTSTRVWARRMVRMERYQ